MSDLSPLSGLKRKTWAPPQWAHGLVGHRDAPVLSEGCEPLISRQDVPLRYRVDCVASRSKLPRGGLVVCWACSVTWR